MGYEQIKKQKVSDVIKEKIGSLIMDGSLRPGEKLPPERELAVQFNTSRPTLRAALNQLEAQSLINRVQGDGNYISDKIESTFTDPILALFQDREEFKYDLLEYRHALEETCCGLAAENATDVDRRCIQQAYDDWLVLHNENEATEIEAEADIAFHLSIAEASHNVILPHAMRSSLSLLKYSVTLNLRNLYLNEGRRKLVHKQHEAMLKAILAGDGKAARAAVRRHLNFVKEEFKKSDIRILRRQR